MISLEEAKAATLEYFEGDELATDVFITKYALRDKENNLLEKIPADMHRRLAREFARIEQGKFKEPLTEEEIFGYFDHYKYIIPQGSPMYGIGNPYQTISLGNCYVLDSPLDSYGSILDVDQQLVQISKRRGGCGIDLSNLRPAGTPTNNSSRTSTGIVPFMKRYSNSIREVGQDGRRGALMLTLSVHHPEVLEFAASKTEKDAVTGANISVRLSDEFLQAVENDEDYIQLFPYHTSLTPSIIKKVSAKKVWNKFVELAHANAEPGLLFWDKIKSEGPANCYEEDGFGDVSTNPCSELPMCSLDSCRLLLKNLLSYVVNAYKENAYFDKEKFYKYSKIAQRLMDDLVDLELETIEKIIKKIQSDPEPDYIKMKELMMWSEIYCKCNNGRRTGTGLTAWGDTIAALGMKFGSEESIQFVDEITKIFKFACYESSIDMAEELGPFPVFDFKKEQNNPFLNRMYEEIIVIENPEDHDKINYIIHGSRLRARMQKFGRRNIALLTTAPAGSVSTQTQTTSSGEPMFNMGYKRRKKINPSDVGARVDFVDQNGDKWTEYMVYEKGVKRWMEATGETDITKSPYYGYCANDINWVNRVKMQAASQRHIDHAISSTVNLPADVSVEEVGKIFLTAWKSGCKGITVYREGCRTGVLVNDDKKEAKLSKTHSPKRPDTLRSQLYHHTIKGQKYFVAIGFLGDDPYEVFAGQNDNAKNINGAIKKIQRGNYQFLDEKGDIVIDDLSLLCNDNEEAIARMVSTALRHGADVNFITTQLEKTKGDIQSFARVISRSLKKLIKDGTKVFGDCCPECKHDLIRESGCSICKNCGFSKCG